MNATQRHDVLIRWGRAALVMAAVLVSMTVGSPTIAHADVNDFLISSYDADYHLTRDSQQHAQLDVTERLTAVFPQADQNHGIQRAIPTTYDGHPVAVSITSVRGDTGTGLQYTTSDSGDYRLVRIGDPNIYVHGPTHYVLRYTVRDVTKNFADHDELYWDTNGTEWAQHISSVTARLYLSGAVASAYTGRNACYQGPSGSTESCPVSQTVTGGERVLTFHATRAFGAHENLTLVAGFRAGTFAAYVPPPPPDPAVVIGVAVWGGLNVAILVIGTVLLVRRWRRLVGYSFDRRRLVPTGSPPRGISLLTAAVLLGRSSTGVVAQLLDLGVRGYLRITEIGPDKRSGHELRLVRAITDLRPEEQALIQVLFQDLVTPGSTVRTNELDDHVRRRLLSVVKHARDGLVIMGLISERTRRDNRDYRRGWLLALLGLVLLQPGLIIIGVAAAASAGTVRPVTPAGWALLDHLRGLGIYMEMTVNGVSRPQRTLVRAVGSGYASTGDTQLGSYEPLLPYAVMFEIESPWMERLAPQYQHTAPTWYVGNGYFLAPHQFAASIRQLATYTAPVNASSSGLNGGYSGGGGGGGGGSGW